MQTAIGFGRTSLLCCFVAFRLSFLCAWSLHASESRASDGATDGAVEEPRKLARSDTLAQQVMRSVHDGDVTALLNALKSLSKIDPNQVKYPLATSRQLLAALSSQDSQWLDSGIKLLIAQQAHRFARARPSSPKARAELYLHLEKVRSLINEKTQPAADLHFELDCVHAALDPATQGRNQPKHWYEVVSAVGMLKQRAEEDQQALKQLRFLLKTHGAKDWRIVYTGLDALTLVVAGNRDLRLVLAAFYGEGETNSATLPNLLDYSDLKKPMLHRHWQLRAKSAQSAILLSKHPNPRIAHSGRTLLAKLKAREEDKRVLLVLGRPELISAVYTALLNNWQVGRDSYEQALAKQQQRLLNARIAPESTKLHLKERGRAIVSAEARRGKVSRSTISVPKSQHNLPAFHARSFIGRKKGLGQVRDRLAGKGPQAPNQITQTLALHGMGGVGKTTLALAYAHKQLGKSYTTAWWIDAENHATLTASLRNIAKRMGMKSAEIDKEKYLLQYVHRKLDEKPDWLLILDNVDDPGVLESVQNKLYPSRGGHVLITSRNANWPHTLQLDAFTEKEAYAFFISFRRPKGSREKAAASRLASEKLGRLPLALAQAGTYIRETGSSFSGYLKLFDEKRTVLERTAKPARGYNRGLTTTTALSLSLSEIEKKYPSAANVAHVMSYLAPDDIPRDLLKQLMQGNAARFNEALKVLKAHGLIQTRSHGKAYRMHRLQQLAIRDRLMEQRKSQKTLQQAVQLLQRVWTYDWNKLDTWGRTSQLAPHVRAVWENVRDKSHGSKKLEKYMIPLTIKMSSYFTNSSTLLKESIEIMKTVFDLNKNSRIKSNDLSDLIITYAMCNRLTGSYEEAIKYYRIGLQKNSKKQGESNRRKAAIHIGLAMTYHDLAQYTTAITHLKKALEIYSALPENSYEIAVCLDSIGGKLARQGNLSEAIKYHKRSVSIQSKMQKKHPFQLATTHCYLGDLYKKTNKIKDAIKNYEKSLEIRLDVFGNDHPETAYSYNGLGNAHMVNKKYENAISFHKKALLIRLNALGEKHRYTANSQIFLGDAYLGRKDYKIAVTYYKRAKKIFESLANLHPDVAFCYDGLGTVHLHHGRYDEAIRNYREGLRIRLANLRERHPELGNSYHHLGSAHASKGESAKALEHLEKALAIRKENLGPNHPDTQATQQALERARKAQATS